ncbi:dephospho-CoA kinase [Kwoniella heveanensis CBS 569]|nr:dephospho-CoA kinase [Kwoniella heveanensis CBS 569]
MLVVGLTGGIASGKSTVSSLLSSRHHIPIIDADLIAREVIEPGTSGYTLVVSHFGADRIIYTETLPNGQVVETLNRGALGDIIFNDPEQRKWLNGVIHPRVRKEMARRVVRAWLGGQWCVVVDVPLLIEAGMWKWVGDVVVVYINERLQLSRLMSRSIAGPPLTQAQASARISSQMPLADKLTYANSVLDNSGTPNDLTAQVDRLVAKWKAQQGGSTGWWWRLCWLIPPVGLTAGALVLLGKWWRGKKVANDKGGRRRGRGEVEKRATSKYGDEQSETIELQELRGPNGNPITGRRRTGTGASSSITDE